MQKFICLLYKLPDTITDVNVARCQLFATGIKPDALPPTFDALHQHTLRGHHQTMIWKQAHLCSMNLLDPLQSGWRLTGRVLEPILMTLDPIPTSCKELISCQCKSGCRTNRCSCRKHNMPCIKVCKCLKADELCTNKTD